MKSGLLVVLCVLLLVGIAQAVDQDPWSGKTFGGYCIALNAETGEGFVYANKARYSMLIVFYPSSNRAYTYSKEGQGLYFADDVREFLMKQGISLDNLISVIKPIR